LFQVCATFFVESFTITFVDSIDIYTLLTPLHVLSLLSSQVCWTIYFIRVLLMVGGKEHWSCFPLTIDLYRFYRHLFLNLLPLFVPIMLDYLFLRGLSHFAINHKPLYFIDICAILDPFSCIVLALLQSMLDNFFSMGC